MYFALRGREVVPCSRAVFCRLLDHPWARIVARHRLADGVEISTVFLGLNHAWTIDGPPVVFETRVFGGPLDGQQDRYYTFGEAEAGHAEMVARVRAGHLTEGT